MQTVHKTYHDCQLCGIQLVTIGNARVNGKKHNDWSNRKYHKQCWWKLEFDHPDFIEIYNEMSTQNLSESDYYIMNRIQKKMIKAGNCPSIIKFKCESLEQKKKNRKTNSYVRMHDPYAKIYENEHCNPFPFSKIYDKMNQYMSKRKIKTRYEIEMDEKLQEIGRQFTIRLKQKEPN